MKPYRLARTTLLLAFFSLAGVSASSACKYCWSAENADAAEYARQTMSTAAAPSTKTGSFPLDSTINQFQAAPVPAALATPPPADSIVTNAADLRAAMPSVPTALASVDVATTSTPTVTKTGGSGHYADAGLLGLAAVGGVFCWRTRRKTGPGR